MWGSKIKKVQKLKEYLTLKSMYDENPFLIVKNKTDFLLISRLSSI